MQRLYRARSFNAFACLAIIFAFSSSLNADTNEAPHDATHKQIRTIKPMVDGEAIKLHTFCLDSEGNILACVGGTSHEYKKTEDSFEIVTTEQPKALQVISPEGELLRSYTVDFTPTAIAVGSDGSIYAAGEGNLVKLSADGKLVKQGTTPNAGDIEELKRLAIEDAKREAEEMKEMFQKQIVDMEKRIAKLTEIPEEDRTKRQKRRLKSTEEQIVFYRDMAMPEEQEMNADELVAEKLGVTAISVTDKDIFLSCAAQQGYGYDIWRVDHNFENGTVVVKDVGGCCGQMDIKADGDMLLIAENTKYRVGIYDRDGAEKSNFGKSSRNAKSEGFASCCNPMNVCCTADGNILTAESSIGNIKLFTPEGEYIGLVGKAKIGGGCKHVALAVDEKRDRYYMMYEDDSSICVLVPLAEAPEFTEDELAAQEAKDGLGKKLLGQWNQTGAEENADDDAMGSMNLLQSAVEFVADGQIKQESGDDSDDMHAMELSWEPISQEGDVLTISLVMDGIEFSRATVKFDSDDQITVDMEYSEPVTYQRAN